MASNPGETASRAIGAVIAGILGLAVVSVIVGRNAQTSNVISAGGGALSSVIGAAVAPVSTGSSTTLPSTPATLLGGTNVGINNGTTNGGFTNLNTITSGLNGVTNLSNAFDNANTDASLTQDFNAFGGG